MNTETVDMKHEARTAPKRRGEMCGRLHTFKTQLCSARRRFEYQMYGTPHISSSLRFSVVLASCFISKFSVFIVRWPPQWTDQCYSLLLYVVIVKFFEVGSDLWHILLTYMIRESISGDAFYRLMKHVNLQYKMINSTLCIKIEVSGSIYCGGHRNLSTRAARACSKSVALI